MARVARRFAIERFAISNARSKAGSTALQISMAIVSPARRTVDMVQFDARIRERFMVRAHESLRSSGLRAVIRRIEIEQRGLIVEAWVFADVEPS